MNNPNPKVSDSNLFELVLASSIHDMKNSIGLLIGKLDILTSRCDNNLKDKSERRQLKQLGQRIQLNLTQLLTLYRIQNKQYYLNVDEHSVEEIFEEVTNTCILLDSNRNIKVSTLCPKNLLAYFDFELITGILNNILGNAYRYAKSKVTICAALDESKQLIITVSDDGPGYPQKMLSSFKNEHTKISFRSGNTGLGLFFSTLVAEMHIHKDKHGYITLANNGTDKGARFKLVLP